MNIPPDTRFAYAVTHEAWYCTAIRTHDRQSVLIQAAADGGGVAWEFIVEQVEHFQIDNLGCGPALRLKMFDDAWDAFVQVPEFFSALQAKRPQHLTALREILDEIGAVDITARTDPDRPLRDRPLMPNVHNIAGEHRGENPEQEH